MKTMLFALVGLIACQQVSLAGEPSVSLSSPSTQAIPVNTALVISATASDSDGDMTEHNLDVQRPDGEWNWEGGWSTHWPFQGGVNGNGFSSSKSVSFTFNEVGTWHVRSAAWDGTGWYYSDTVEITVVEGTPPTVTLNSPASQTIALNTALTIAATATDPDGNMTEHNLDIQRPDGQWNWEGGWSTQWPFQGGVNGSGYNSSKSTSFTFNQPGVWHVRSAAWDGTGWYYSDTVEITVTNVTYGRIDIPATISVGTWTVTFSIEDNGTVVGGKTYANRYEGNHYVSYEVREPRDGPGYVTWYEMEVFDSWQYPNTNYVNHNQMLARYIRSTRSWVVTTIGTHRTGWGTSWQYGWQTPLSLGLNLFSYRTTYNYDTYPYTEHQDPHSYSIPTQPL